MVSGSDLSLPLLHCMCNIYCIMCLVDYYEEQQKRKQLEQQANYPHDDFDNSIPVQAPIPKSAPEPVAQQSSVDRRIATEQLLMLRL